MAVSHLHIHYSRMVQIFVFSDLLMVVMVLLLVMAYERRRAYAARPASSKVPVGKAASGGADPPESGPERQANT